jgi:tetratricopeptide (TPR) repeat protein
LDPHQDSLYSNRGLCYLDTKKYKYAIADLSKAINLNPRNIKAYKRLAHIKTALGELAEAEIYVKRCAEVEPDEQAHRDDINKIRDLIHTHEELKKAKFRLDYKEAELLADKLLKTNVETSDIKMIYIESLLQNCKVEEALKYIKRKLTDDEKKMEDFEYLLSLAYYYDGK